MQYPEVKIASLDAWWVTAGQLLTKETLKYGEVLDMRGEGETSISLWMFGELVEMEYAKGVVPSLPPYIDIKWDFAELTNCGATGDPTKATPEKGKRMEEVLINVIVDFIKKMDENEWNYKSEKSLI